MAAALFRGISATMREFRLSDIELQRLLATALKARLRKEGFQFGAAERSDCQNSMAVFPVNLDLAGAVNIDRGEDGIWTFQQHDPFVLSRHYETFADHLDVIEKRESKQ